MSTSDEPTLEQLRKRAAELEVEGRSKMDRDELVTAIDVAEGRTIDGPEPPASDGGEPTDAELDADELAGGVQRPPVGDPAAVRDPAPPLLDPGTEREVGQPDLIAVAQRRDSHRVLRRVIGETPTQEDN